MSSLQALIIQQSLEWAGCRSRGLCGGTSLESLYSGASVTGVWVFYTLQGEWGQVVRVAPEVLDIRASSMTGYF